MPRPRVAPGSANETPLASISTNTKRNAKMARKVTAVTTFEPCSKAKRAATWLLPKMTEMHSSVATPIHRGIGLPGNSKSCG